MSRPVVCDFAKQELHAPVAGSGFAKEIPLPIFMGMRSINRALFIDADEEQGLCYEVGSAMFQGSCPS